MLPLDSIFCDNNVDVLRHFPDACIDLTVTSPPYDNLRKYNGYSFDFEGVARELWRVTKQGGVVVWVVADATVDGSETGTSFEQALHFKRLGFRLHDTMIYQKVNQRPRQSNRYEQSFEYMFVLSKGAPKTTRLRQVPCKQAGRVQSTTSRDHDSDELTKVRCVTKDTKNDGNVWSYLTGASLTTSDKEAFKQPAIFPEKLAQDHILSWSNEGDVVLDPFSGSGTTAKMALLNGRHYIGIDVSEEYCEIARKRIESAVAQQQSRPAIEQAVLF